MGPRKILLGNFARRLRTRGFIVRLGRDESLQNGRGLQISRLAGVEDNGLPLGIPSQRAWDGCTYEAKNANGNASELLVAASRGVERLRCRDRLLRRLSR